MIKTKLGLTTVEKNFYCGFDVSQELVGTSDTLDLITLATIERRLTPTEKRIIYALSTSQCIADPHAWPLKIARVGARYGSFFRGLGSVISYFDRAKIGPHQTQISAKILIEWKNGNKRELLKHYETQSPLPGFGVFGRPKDERVAAFKKWLMEENFDGGDYFREYESLTKSIPQRHENNTLISAAILLDMGFSVEDMEPMAFFLLLPPVFANAVESSKDQNEELRNIPGPVEYRGPGARKSPRSQSVATNRSQN